MHFKYDNFDGTFNLGDIIFVKPFNATTKNVTHVKKSYKLWLPRIIQRKPELESNLKTH